MVFKYSWKLDIKGMRRAKFLVSRTFTSDFNADDGSYYTSFMSRTYMEKPMKNRVKFQKLSISDNFLFSNLTTSFQFRCVFESYVCVFL